MFINNPTATMVAQRKVEDMNMMGRVWGRRIVSLLGKRRMSEYPYVRFLMRSIITHVMMKNMSPAINITPAEKVFSAGVFFSKYTRCTSNPRPSREVPKAVVIRTNFTQPLLSLSSLKQAYVEKLPTPKSV